MGDRDRQEAVLADRGLLRQGAAAARLGVSVEYLRGLTKRGHLRLHKVNFEGCRKVTGYDVAEIEALARKLGRAP